jgi:hypothetical protein
MHQKRGKPRKLSPLQHLKKYIQQRWYNVKVFDFKNKTTTALWQAFQVKLRALGAFCYLQWH